MSSLSQGQILKLRHKSKLTSAEPVGRAEPLFVMGRLCSGTAPGAAGAFVFVAPGACRIARIDYVADTNGAGSSKIYVRKHVSGQTAAANAATSGTDIVDVVSGGIAADSTVRVPTNPTIDTANDDMVAGDKLAIVTPATWVGCATVYGVWR
jgi:hypothetical protein